MPELGVRRLCSRGYAHADRAEPGVLRCRSVPESGQLRLLEYLDAAVTVPRKKERRPTPLIEKSSEAERQPVQCPAAGLVKLHVERRRSGIYHR